MTTQLTVRRRSGVTLVELLIGMAIFGVVMSAGMGFMMSQSRGLRVLSDRSNTVQNGRFSRDLMRQELRAAGTNVTDVQPILVLANDSAMSFNADLTTRNRDSVALTGAVYVDTYASEATVSAITIDRQFVVPGSRPSLSYPLQSYSQVNTMFINSDAELVTYRFTPDTAGPTGTYALFRHVNDAPAELVATGLRRVTNRPFFRYWYDPSRYGANEPDLDTVPRNWLPLTKSAARRGLDADTGIAVSARIDQLRAVEVTYEARAVGGSKAEVVNYIVPMPNVENARQSRACGRPPLQPTTPTVTWRSDSQFVQITIPAATDDGAGEKDAIRYVIWRQQSGVTTWGEPISTVAATQRSSYIVRDAGWPVRGTTYRYGVAVQDCTPNVSSMTASAAVLVP
ncbi:MAG: prepilin-type N-terminal cleavage/methylation domain-containing protein [Gemmatimonadaceae bacterium]|nr:prepilin-type N-terminal cleavage/methylation domain-containing protein [Gemmatimonadaceae bacterium]